MYGQIFLLKDKTKTCRFAVKHGDYFFLLAGNVFVYNQVNKDRKYHAYVTFQYKFLNPPM